VDEYSLADLVVFTGAKPRTLQIWAERGVIQPIKRTSGAGTGVHRRFSRSEAIVACVIHPFALRQISIGELLSISEIVRASYGDVPEIWESAVGHSGDTMFTVQSFYEKKRLMHWTSISPVELEHVQKRGVIPFAKSREPGALIMAIRLESYFAKLPKRIAPIPPRFK
jgi:hypothetical protein